MPFCSRVAVRAPGKLNLCLDVVGEDGAGYHLLDGVMLAVDLCDVAVISRREDGALRLSCNWEEIPADESNLGLVAARRFFAAAGLPVPGLSIHLDKAVPTQAGMGGGSADAAAVLVGLNRMFEVGLTRQQLAELGRGVGSDVPFCLEGGCARARGRGERLEPLPLPAGGIFVIAKPDTGMSSREAFARYDGWEGALPRPKVAAMARALCGEDLAGVGASMANVFTPIVQQAQAERLGGIMAAQGALGAAMTGTGTAVAGLFGEEAGARRCRERLREERGLRVWLARPLAGGARVIWGE